MHYRFATSRIEILEAQKIVYESFDFSKFSTNPRLKEFESDLNSSNFQNYFLSLDVDKVIGVVRTVPRIVNFHKFSIAGLEWTDFATTAVGRDFDGIRLLSQFLSTEYVASFAFVLGNARKIMDDYYSRFGFFDVSAFPTLRVERSESVETSYRIEKVENFDSIDTFQLEEFRINSNKLTNGFLERTNLEWAVFLHKISSSVSLALYLVYNFDSYLVGYFVKSTNEVIECSLPPHISLPEFLSLSNDIIPTSKIVFRLPLKHALFTNLGRSHLSISYRRVPNCGIICKVTNFGVLTACISKSELPETTSLKTGIDADLIRRRQEKDFVIGLFSSVNFEEYLFGLDLAWHLANFDFSGEYFL
jgi:hypothetical protein